MNGDEEQDAVKKSIKMGECGISISGLMQENQLMQLPIILSWSSTSIHRSPDLLPAQHRHRVAHRRGHTLG